MCKDEGISDDCWVEDCEDCRYWKQLRNTEVGTCAKIGYESTEGGIEIVRDRGHMYTSCDFTCSEWEGKEEEHPKEFWYGGWRKTNDKGQLLQSEFYVHLGSVDCFSVGDNELLAKDICCWLNKLWARKGGQDNE